MHISGRFAPSPTGPLHAGSVVAALGSYVHAKRAGGTWRVRIEDVDRTREIPGAASQQLEQLSVLGFHADGDIVRQSDRGHLYQDALNALIAQDLAFECHCSRTDLIAQGGIHRHCVAGQRRPDPAWRLRVPAQCTIQFEDVLRGSQSQRVDECVGDFVLKRSDGHWAYQLAVVIDDAAQQITEVVRGADLLDSTARQRLLQQYLSLPTPTYLHLPLLLDDEGKKYSKSLNSEAITAVNATRHLQQAWQILGQEAVPDDAQLPVEIWLQRAIDRFELHRIPTVSVQA